MKGRQLLRERAAAIDDMPVEVWLLAEHRAVPINYLHVTISDAAIDWVVEEAFADVVRLHPGVRRVLPVAIRRWRGSLLAPATWSEMPLAPS